MKLLKSTDGFVGEGSDWICICYGSYPMLHSLKTTDQTLPIDILKAVLIQTFLTTQPSDGSYQRTSYAYMYSRKLIQWTEVPTGTTQVIGLNLSLALVASHLS